MNGNKKSAKQYHQSVITALEKKVNDMKDSAYSGLYSEIAFIIGIAVIMIDTFFPPEETKVNCVWKIILIATVLVGMFTLDVYGLGYKIFLAVETGIFITAGTLPLIVIVVFFSRTYVFSVLLCIFYSVLNMSATALFDALPKTILWLLPTPLTTFWSAGDMKRHGINMNLEQMNGLIPSTFQVILILGIMAGISILLIDCLYKKRGE